MKKRIAILGSTGSIGTQTLEVVGMFPEKFEVVGLAAGSNIDKLIQQALFYRPQTVSIGREEDIPVVRASVPGGTKVLAGTGGMVELVASEDIDIVVTSITGTLGLIPTIEAIRAGRNIALANKETLVAAGQIVMALARQKGVSILPVDSEHSAIFQCLQGENRRTADKLILTASGGPFFNRSGEDLALVTVDEALKHPNWNMGYKITVDSATMMNKGLEVIEAGWLFDMDFSRIEVMIHPQSIIHSMVEFADGSVIAQMGNPDMRVPIQYALSYPERWKNDLPRLDLVSAGCLTFEKPRTDVFPCLELAFAAGQRGGTMPAVMNAANEEAVGLFLGEKISFIDIPSLIEKTMGKHDNIREPGLDDIIDSDRWARLQVRGLAGY
ncbi:MAG: 1-deoxy-D-xylulose-5-phosphate reductoisomerase [Firmicutes bacterium HGW-Firmicutes-14]|nr:MAG: 1-deoxy-D-xylulose-5-phosphate reductoisomerase [Firmicutes bacterium HGW-Firmicutes-14]